MSPSSVVLLPYAPSSVAVARQCLSSDLQEWGVYESAIDDAVLVVSELLSNALRHAHPLPSGQIKVAWRWTDGHVEVAVSDGGAATEPRAGRAPLSSLGGRGLGIVEYLADRWGVRHEGEITTVWAIVTTLNHKANGQELGGRIGGRYAGNGHLGNGHQGNGHRPVAEAALPEHI